MGCSSSQINEKENKKHFTTSKTGNSHSKSDGINGKIQYLNNSYEGINSIEDKNKVRINEKVFQEDSVLFCSEKED